jgi:ssDNA-binding Zn-finger/Zn-ribbon topoisomerase 1
MEKPFPENLKERTSMKCPVCGNKLEKAARCDNCGNDMSRSRNGLEVEYKEFPVSELLEIRQKPQTDRLRRKGISHTPDSLTEARATRGSPSLGAKNTLLKSIVILLIVLTVIISVLLLADFSP